MDKTNPVNDEIHYVKKSTQRTKVMKSLKGGAKMPSKIAKDTEILQNHISSVLKQLREHELVECINPEFRKGRLYRLTDKAEELVKNLE